MLMPKLTEEDLAKIYPTPKTYDELQTERELREEAKRPKFVAAKIALWASLFVPVVAITGYAALRVARSPETIGSSMAVLAGVCIVILLVIVGLAALYYLWSLIESLASKTIIATSLFSAALLAILGLTGGAGVVLYLYGFHPTVITLIMAAVVFVSSFIATKKIKAIS